MSQDIRFLEVDGRRLAYAVTGAGPPLVVGTPWVSHLEEEWEDPDQRAFYGELAQTHQVVRYDRMGCGLSSRELAQPLTAEREADQLEAVVEAVGGDAVMFAFCYSTHATALLATRRPELVSKIVFFGGHATRHDIPDATRRSLIEFTRLNWRLSAQMLAGLFDPHASGDQITRYTRMQVAAASADAAAGFLELNLVADLRPLLPHVQTPSLVLHRRGDRAVPIARGRELASLLPNARFVPLAGDSHLPWRDDRRELMRALAGFLHGDAAPEGNGDSPLSSREAEVLRLVSTGMSNREIAATLVLSEHTVHRHVANILRKLALSSRAAAAAQAARAGII